MDLAWGGTRTAKTDCYVATDYKTLKLKSDTIVYKGDDDIDWWR